MHFFLRFALFSLLVFNTLAANAGRCLGNTSVTCPTCCDRCCGEMGGISYCDSSAGRFVCNNGYYSSCYCTRHAVMDFQHLQGCCLWQGGIMATDPATGAVVCNNGSVSEVCSVAEGTVAAW